MLLKYIGCAKTSSDYKWFSSDVATVSVSAFGVVQAKKPGNATLKVVSIFDSSNYDEVIDILVIYLFYLISILTSYYLFFEFSI